MRIVSSEIEELQMAYRNGEQAVLVVEDESLLRVVAADMLEYAGFRVIEASNADAALDLIESGTPISGLFTDIEMPGRLDGVALAHITHERNPDAAILVVSGRRYLEGSDLPPGAIFMGKPYDFNAVIATLDKMIDGH
jgi:two-component system, response regulator PdtaR